MSKEIARRAFQRYLWRVRAECQPTDEQEAKRLQDLDWEMAEMELGKVAE